jgi:leucyl aminopeptidase (aminopeptidase T)
MQKPHPTGSLELAEHLNDSSIHVKRGDSVYVAGNSYALDILDNLTAAFQARGARTMVKTWTDTEIVADISQNDPKALSTQWIPEPRGKGKAFIFGRGVVKLDKAVTLFSGPFSVPLWDVAPTFKGRKTPDLAKRIGLFRSYGGANISGEFRASGIGLVLLDIAAPAFSEAVKLNHRRVVRCYEKALSIDYREMGALGKKLTHWFADRDRVRITCPRGTDFSFRLGPIGWRSEECSLRHEWMVQLPGGEVFKPPDHTSGEGHVIVNDKRGGRLMVTFRKGVAVSARRRTGRGWTLIEHSLANGTEYFCEFGIGTNFMAEPLLVGPIYEKAFGTVHVGVGGNAFFGGPLKSRLHGDFIIIEPSVTVDGEQAMTRGRWRKDITGR